MGYSKKLISLAIELGSKYQVGMVDGGECLLYKIDSVFDIEIWKYRKSWRATVWRKQRLGNSYLFGSVDVPFPSEMKTSNEIRAFVQKAREYLCSKKQ